MTQTPFQAFGPDMKMDTVESVNLIPSIEKNQKELLNSLKERNKQLLKYELEAAKRKDNLLPELAKFSQSAATALKPMLEANRNEAYMKGAEEWYNLVAENQDVLQSEFDQDEFNESLIASGNNKIVSNSKEKGEIDSILASKLRELPGRQQTGFLKAMYADHLEGYEAFVDEASKIPIEIKVDGKKVLKALEDADDQNEYNAILRRINRAYIRPFASHEQPMVNKHLYEGMRKKDQQSYRDWYTKKSKALDAEHLARGKEALIEGLEGEDPGGALLKYTNEYSFEHGGLSGAKEQGFKILNSQADAGLMSEDIIDRIGSTPFIPEGSTKETTIDAHFKTQMRILRDKEKEKRIADRNTKDKLNDIEFKDKETDLFDNLPEQPTNEDIEAAQAILVKDHGKRSSKLDAVKKDLTISAKHLKLMNKEAEKLANVGLLTQKRLVDNFPWQVQRAYADVARMQTETQGKTKVYVDAIGDMVKVASKVLPDGTTGPTSRILTARLQHKYAKRVAELKINPETAKDAEINAFAEIKDEFDTYWNVVDKGKSKDGFNVLPAKEKVVKSAELANQEIKMINGTLNAKGANSIYETATFFDEGELKANEKGFGKPGWSPHPKAVYIAEQLGVDPLTVLNAQRKGYDLDPLEETSSFKAFNGISPDYQKILCRYNSAERSCRAWASRGEFNKEIIPNGKAEEVLTKAKELDVDPALLAGYYEISTNGEWNNLEVGEDFDVDLNFTADMMKSAAKYGYQGAWNNPLTMRPTIKLGK